MIRVLVSTTLAVVLLAGSSMAGTLVTPDQLSVHIDGHAYSPNGLSTDFGGTYRIDIQGAPDWININGLTSAAISAGDTVTVTLAHSNLGNFSHTRFWLDGLTDQVGDGTKIYDNEQIRGSEPVNALYDATWIADRDYAAGTIFGWGSAVWPGAATYWFKEATVTSAVPLPAAAWLGLALMGALGIARRIRRRRTG